jgi:hypothetical protein
MDLDDELQTLREIGERNKVTLSLLRNWCAHAEVVSEGSGGLFQQMTGLPIAMCRVTCKHERAVSSISMHLDENALDFHDRNCVDCDKRVPVAFPNLSHLVGERDRARDQGAQAAAERQRAERDLLEARVTARGQAFAEPTPAQKSLLALLDRLDCVPAEETEREFVSGMRAVGDVVNDSFREAVIAVIRAGGPHRVRAGLLALEATRYDSVSLGTLALEALARDEAVDTAADLAVRHMAHCHREQIRGAAPALLLLARSPVRSGFDRDVVSRPEALVAAYRTEPDIMRAAIEHSLASESKEWRLAGCSAVVTLIREGIDFDVMAITKALVESFRLPDDIYYPGPVYSTIAWVLAELLDRFQEPVATILVAHEEDGDERVRAGVFRAYTEVFRQRDLCTGEVVTERAATGRLRPDAVETRVFERIVAIVSSLAADERLRLAIEFMGRADRWIVDLQVAASFAPVLLGIAAVACERADAAGRGSSVIIDPRPESVRELDLVGTARELSGLAAQLLKLVTQLARKHPDAGRRAEIVRVLLETLRALPRHADLFRAELVRQLGKLYIDRSLRDTLLPEIYSAMTHTSVRVRSAASSAYVDVCSQVSPEVLPSLLHESFLVHLQDPYVAVHRVALRYLHRIALPQAYRRRAFELVAGLVAAYRDEREGRDEFFLADALSQLVRLGPEDSGPAEAVQEYAVEVARSLSVEALYSFLRESARWLRTTPGFGELVSALPFRTSLFDHRSEFVLGELQKLPPQEVSRIADRLIDTGVAAARRNPLAVIPLLKLLDQHGQSEAAHRLAVAAVQAGGSDRSKLPERLRMSIYSKALELESSLQEGRLEEVDSLAGEIRRLEAEIADDELVNRERRSRDVFP